MTMRTFKKVVMDGDLDGSFSSDPISIHDYNDCGVQIKVVTTDNEGQFNIEVTNDPSDDNMWDVIDFDPVIPPLAAADLLLTLSMVDVPFTHIRVVYSETAPGTGSVKIIAFGKEA